LISRVSKKAGIRSGVREQESADKNQGSGIRSQWAVGGLKEGRKSKMKIRIRKRIKSKSKIRIKTQCAGGLRGVQSYS
jgi:hypothetical protein